MNNSESRASERYELLRHQMVDEQIARRGVKDPRVLAALKKVERHLFVPAHLRPQAYEDYPLPIGHGQTISQPYIVAAMTEELNLKRDSTVLEVGTGSGYQTAILAELCREVYTIEAVPELAESARKILEELGYTNIHYHIGDGSIGWPEDIQFDAIMVTAAAPSIPGPLKNQLKVGGVIVIPIGDRMYQELVRSVRVTEKKWKTKNLFPCAFVPLLGKYGFRRSDPF